MSEKQETAVQDDAKAEWLKEAARRRRIRLACGGTLLDIAEVCVVSESYVYYWERGTRRPKPEHSRLWLAALKNIQQRRQREWKEATEDEAGPKLPPKKGD
jgi:transcriptional regulator with XRE-family HTH domain